MQLADQRKPPLMLEEQLNIDYQILHPNYRPHPPEESTFPVHPFQTLKNKKNSRIASLNESELWNEESYSDFPMEFVTTDPLKLKEVHFVPKNSCYGN